MSGGARKFGVFYVKREWLSTVRKLGVFYTKHERSSDVRKFDVFYVKHQAPFSDARKFAILDMYVYKFNYW